MRSKLPVYATHDLATKPDRPSYKTIYVLATDGLTYAKNSAGVSGALAAGAATVGAVSIGATLDATPALFTQYPIATKGQIRVISVDGVIGSDGSPLNPGIVVKAKDYLLCIQDSLGGIQAAADWVIVVPTERVKSIAKDIAKTEVIIETSENLNDVAGIFPISLNVKNTRLNTNVGNVGTGVFSLAAGVEGQKKTIVLTGMLNAMNAIVQIPDLFGGTQLTFSANGQSIELLFLNLKWYIVNTPWLSPAVN